jgi:hypothetical protein
MSRRIRLAACVVALSGAWLAGSAPAGAIEIRCVEASKYKYLYRLFDNDKRRAAAFLSVKPSSLPDGEICRAVIVTEGIVPASIARKEGTTPDTVKLLRAIERNRGWLATVYLASGGGSVDMGIALARLIRTFWLKTFALEEPVFAYYPDFGVVPATVPAEPKRRTGNPDAKAKSDRSSPASAPPPPPAPLEELAAGWSAYLESAPYQVRVKFKRGRGRCASACTYLHVAGIDRRGVMHVHRPRFSADRVDDKTSTHSLDMKKSMTDTLKGLQRAEARGARVYQEMDAGDEAIALRASTPTAKLSPIAVPRFPRYVADYLRDRCGGDAEALERQEAGIRALLAKRPDDAKNPQERLRDVRARRGQVEKCIAGAHEAERLKQFVKYCSSDTCDRRAIAADIRGGTKSKSRNGKKPRKSRRQSAVGG